MEDEEGDRTQVHILPDVRHVSSPTPPSSAVILSKQGLEPPTVATTTAVVSGGGSFPWRGERLHRERGVDRLGLFIKVDGRESKV